MDVGSDGSSICRVSPRPQAKATKSKREEPESARAFREFIEGAGPTDKVEQGGVVVRSNGVVDSAATINGAKEMGEAMLDTFGEEAVLALKGRHGCNGLEILLDGLNFLGRKLDFECIGANGHSEAS